MTVSFIIPLFNCVDLTRECLRTLRATLPPGLDHEILLVDDGSTDGTRAWLATLAAPCRHLLNERNLGFGPTCNRGAAAARGEILFLLNSDLVLLPGWFEPMLAVFAAEAGAGVVGNVQLACDTGRVDHAGIFFDHQGKPAHLTRVPRAAAACAVPAVTGACCAVRAALWRDLGGFDESYRNGGEDVDFCLRVAAAGRTNFVAPASVVRHHVSRSPGRKENDEANSRRLMLRWRQVVAPLAAPAWSRHYLAREWSGAYATAECRGAARAVLHAAGLARHPGSFAARGAELAIERELARWRTIFDGEPPATAETCVTL